MLKRKHEHRVPLFEQENDNSVQRKKVQIKVLSCFLLPFLLIYQKHACAVPRPRSFVYVVRFYSLFSVFKVKNGTY